MVFQLSMFVFVTVITLNLTMAHPDSFSFPTIITSRKNYVTPNRSTSCLVHKDPCLTLNEYANEPDKHFINNTTFYFYFGDHELNTHLWLKNLHSIAFRGLSDDKLSSIVSSASITWEKCENIEISLIVFTLTGNFTFILVFNQTHFIHLSNISILGNENSGCSSIMSQDSTIDIIDSRFVGLLGLSGAALMVSGSNITFAGNNSFISNVATFGGAIHLTRSMLFMNGTNLFMNNTAMDSSERILDDTLCKVSIEVVNFQNNGSGGAIFCDNSTLTFDEDSNFIDNSAKHSGGAIATVNVSTVTTQGLVLFDRNSAIHSGGALTLLNTKLQSCGSISLTNNRADFGGALHMVRSEISFNDDNNVITFQNSTTFRHNKAMKFGGSIGTHNSLLQFVGNVLFDGNTADIGGAIALYGTTKLILKPELNIYFILNHANKTGGVIFVQDVASCQNSVVDECFFSIIDKNVSLIFLDNSAKEAGTVLYGGKLGKCGHYCRSSSNLDICRNRVGLNYCNTTGAIDVFKMISTMPPDNNSISASISSDAEQISFCHHNCTKDHCNISVYPGQSFNVSLVAFGQANLSVTPAKVLVDSNDERYRLSSKNHEINAACSNVSYRLYTATSAASTTVQYKLYHDNPCKSLVTGVNLSITVLPCPLGFSLSKTDVLPEGTCVCNTLLQKFTNHCYIDDFSIERRKNNFWVSQQDDKSGLVLHQSGCPFDFCKINSVNVTLAKPYVQCDFNRTGVLCGVCIENHSLVLGSLHCISCSNNFIALTLSFALAGIALIAVIFLLRLTVAVGTLNGLIFYANIVQANCDAFFPRNTINFFTVFIAWLNLDLGIETCFYDGMDIYAYSWLQFVFPFYVWFLIASLILISHYSQTIAKSLGQNPVAMLATLLLMSYSKISKAIITPLSGTYLTYTFPSESHHVVWLYNGSVDYIKDSKHLVLAIFAVLIFLLLFLPYTLLLLCGHWVQACSHWWFLSWINKIKPFMDTYYAPYKDNARYWTGLLVLARGGLFLTIASNAIGSGRVNLLAISSVATALAVMKGRVYKKHYNDILDSSFVLNLCIFSVATFYIQEEESGSQYILSGVSVGTAFVIFVGILIFHLYLQLEGTNVVKKSVVYFTTKYQQLNMLFGIGTGSHPRRDTELVIVPSTTTIQLREPLLESEDA